LSFCFHKEERKQEQDFETINKTKSKQTHSRREFIIKNNNYKKKKRKKTWKKRRGWYFGASPKKTCQHFCTCS